MKMRLVRMILSCALIVLMLAPAARAVQYVTFDDIPGDWNDYEANINWLNADYVPTLDYAWVDTELLEGGWVAPGVFEYIGDPSYAYQNPKEILAYFYIDAPGESLYVSVFEGNWETKEYMLMSNIATNGMFVDMFFPSFDREGKLLNTDRIYLYEYEVNGEWYCECATFYFRYDGEETRSFLPGAADSATVKQEEEKDEDEVTTEEVITDEELFDSNDYALYEDIFSSDDDTLNEDLFGLDDVIVAENESATIGIIGGADGPTSVIVGDNGSKFSAFFGNMLEGLLGGAE